MDEKRLFVAAAYAGAWWAERLPESYDQERQAVGTAIAIKVLHYGRGWIDWKRVKSERNGVDVWTDTEYVVPDPQPQQLLRIEFDYAPDALLRDVLLATLPELPEFRHRSCSWPPKHSLMVDFVRGRLIPKEGYGQFRDDILLPEELPT